MKILRVLLALFVSQKAIACPDILGSWQSSKELSMEYNNKFGGITEPQREFLEQTLGIVKLTYTDSSIHSHGAPTLNITINNKKNEFVFEDLKYKYEVLGCTGTSIEVKQYYPYGDPITSVLNFVDRNTYWVAPKQLPKTREYFIRVAGERT